MALNRSINCVFRYASSPYILGTAPFTNVSEKIYLSMHSNFLCYISMSVNFSMNETCLIIILFEMCILSITGNIQKILQCSKMFKQSQI